MIISQDYPRERDTALLSHYIVTTESLQLHWTKLNFTFCHSLVEEEILALVLNICTG